ncbi:hypothetical protein Deipr_1247 [Deinococcus proteolyticus MRP]|uniref:Uncharacterized protein n=1 Tax=Deinococcus proteolyticus (strain ATCC 35074 / DSM 20540 / JCM 6276 / NBRC 101906 / NCIMB 13154 / VKM Ac-1939 / CCM 2703 / MRP) TaxID=693977 RepID=F0RNY8_DEIPM|nr:MULTISPECIES: hypothetical protein [Deinococcus]ADY26397.1 hypothetical protein Deipr_1247 [Deinococcus proteolyticus MRP]MCY1702516.1 hypothetical protein [Deinococcus sp. SL84]
MTVPAQASGISGEPDGTEPFRWPLKPFLLGWALAAAAALLVRWLGQRLLGDPCQGHTVLALLMPLLLGPGGLGLAASQWNNRPRAMFGLGLVLASFVPTLLLSAYDIGQLRNLGCAGGYLIVSEPGGKQLSEITLAAGQSRELQGRIGGYQRESHPGIFQLQGQSMSSDLVVDLPKTAVHAGEVFPVRIHAKDTAVSNRFDWGVQAKYQPTPGEGGSAAEIETSGKLSVTIILDRSGK